MKVTITINGGGDDWHACVQGPKIDLDLWAATESDALAAALHHARLALLTPALPEAHQERG